MLRRTPAARWSVIDDLSAGVELHVEGVLGPAAGYKTREEAMHAMKIAKACESR
jgi:hypothetical protein